MIAAWLEAGELEVRRDVERPEPGLGEALVRVSAAGLCGTDLEMLRGYRDFTGIPGHELAGVVIEGPEPWLGARVVSEINVTCASFPGARDPCPACGAGRRAHCERRAVLGISGRPGAFAEYIALPVANLHRIPEAVSDEAAVLAEPLAAAFRVTEQVEIEDQTRVLIVGFGRLGQLVARVLIEGAAVDAVARSKRDPGPLADRGLRCMTPDAVRPGAYDLAIECSGRPEGFALARAALRAGGTLVLKSTYADELRCDASSLVVDEIRVIGSRCGPFPTALRSLAEGRVTVDDLIDARFPLAEAPAAYEEAARPGVRKVLLLP